MVEVRSHQHVCILLYHHVSIGLLFWECQLNTYPIPDLNVTHDEIFLFVRDEYLMSIFLKCFCSTWFQHQNNNSAINEEWWLWVLCAVLQKDPLDTAACHSWCQGWASLLRKVMGDMIDSQGVVVKALDAVGNINCFTSSSTDVIAWIKNFTRHSLYNNTKSIKFQFNNKVVLFDRKR